MLLLSIVPSRWGQGRPDENKNGKKKQDLTTVTREEALILTLFPTPGLMRSSF